MFFGLYTDILALEVWNDYHDFFTVAEWSWKMYRKRIS